MTAAAQTQSLTPHAVVRLLDRLVHEVNLTVRSQSVEAVHDLRVAIRRFSQGLALLKHHGWSHEIKSIRKRLDELLTAAGPVRDCDIAIKLIAKYDDPAVPSLRNE